MDFKNFKYVVKGLTEKDIPAVLALYFGNPEYFRHCPPSPTSETVKEDMKVFPPAASEKDKHFIGFFEGNELIAVMDIIENYPDNETVFIGLFMVEKGRQKTGIGTSVVSEFFRSAKAAKYKKVRLGYVKTNLSARDFWKKQGFYETGKEVPGEFYTVVEAEKVL